uniref:elongin-A isoform X2 n=1 Tax=Doryrhamphus excisus TaxID=161450 RepID=UPI0025AE2228|nr:elongin-A isoform X2 [Doryrhamphus excisus]
MAIKQRLKVAEICFPIGMKPLPGQHLPAVNMAEGLLETVDRLQSRLMESPEPRKLLKTLKRLGELPMTVDILVETGVGKTVNSFRKHEVAAEVAKGLVAKWKKLVPQPADRSGGNHAKEAPRSHSRGSSDAGQRHQREPSPEEEKEPSYVEEEEEEDEGRSRHASYSPSPPRPEQYSPRRPGGDQSDEYDSPEPEPEPSPPPRRDDKHAKPGKAHGNHRHDKQRRHHMPGARDGGPRSEGKKRRADREPSPPAKSTKQDRKSHEDRKGGDDGRPLPAHKDSPGAGGSGEDDFETPTMSFESFLTYDAPTSSSVKKKKKKKTTTSHGHPSHASHASHASTAPSHRRTSQPAPLSSSSSSSSKASKTNGATRTRRSDSDLASAVPAKRRKAVEPLPSLPEIPLPDIQPNYRPLPSIDITPLSPQRRKGPVYNDEEDAGFTGKRFNSKMVVYSGSKTSYLPRMMTLYEQCIRVLQNNIDCEWGGLLGAPELMISPPVNNAWLCLCVSHCRGGRGAVYHLAAGAGAVHPGAAVSHRAEQPVVHRGIGRAVDASLSAGLQAGDPPRVRVLEGALPAAARRARGAPEEADPKHQLGARQQAQRAAGQDRVCQLGRQAAARRPPPAGKVWHHQRFLCSLHRRRHAHQNKTSKQRLLRRLRPLLLFPPHPVTQLVPLLSAPSSRRRGNRWRTRLPGKATGEKNRPHDGQNNQSFQE